MESKSSQNSLFKRFVKFILFSTIFVAIIVAFIAVAISYFTVVPPTPQLKNTWWRPGLPQNENTAITPFMINISESVLEDLKLRLESTVIQTKSLVNDHTYGLNNQLLNNFVQFWKTKYDWRQRERFLNQFPQYQTKIQGLNIHFIRVSPKNPTKKVVPLLLMHGWPGSVLEFYEVIHLLATDQKDQNFVFDLIVPSLPGYGFSEGATKPGLGAPEVAVVFNNLMHRLNYTKYYIQGGDWGATIAIDMATLFPDNILGLHSNMCTHKTNFAILKMVLGSICPWVPNSKLYPFTKTLSFLLAESGYFHIQATKPDTVGVALSNSPVGLLAYILEKFVTWTDPKWIEDPMGGDLLKKYDHTKLLDNIMIYWVTQSITTSMRFYAENMSKTQSTLALIPTNVPSACAKFPNELYYQPDFILIDKYQNLVRSTDFERGGHFAAFEEPNLMAEDIWLSVEKFISLQK